MTRQSIICLVLCCLVQSGPLLAQGTNGVPRSSALFQTVQKLDKELFDAYNSCDLAKFKSLLDDDLEFYHDQGGVMTGAGKVTESVRANICGKVRRDLVESTLEVHEMRGFGAIQMGVHRFFQIQNDPDKPSGEARFTHLWRYKDGVWKATRILSFDHRGLKK